MKSVTIFFVGLGLVLALIVGLVVRDRINEAKAMKAVEQFRQEQDEALKETEQQFQLMFDKLNED